MAGGNEVHLCLYGLIQLFYNFKTSMYVCLTDSLARLFTRMPKCQSLIRWQASVTFHPHGFSESAQAGLKYQLGWL